MLGRRNNTLNGTGINQSGSTSVNILSSKKSGNNIVITINSVCETSKVKRENKPKLSIASIAKKIAQDEEKVDDQGISEDVVKENYSLEEESSNYLLEE